VVAVAHAASGETYGASRVHEDVQAERLPTSRKRVARLMRQEGLVARAPKKRRIATTDSNHASIKSGQAQPQVSDTSCNGRSDPSTPTSGAWPCGVSRKVVERDNTLGRDVVIKVLVPEFAEGRRAGRFPRGIQVIAAF